MSDQPNPFPDDLNPATLPPELKKEGNDWFVAFNPKVKRTLDVSLVHTLMHATYVASTLSESCTLMRHNIASSAVFSSQPTASFSPQGAIGPPRFMMSRQGKKLGRFTAAPSVSI